MGEISPVLRGDLSISDLIREAAERSIAVDYVADPSARVETRLMSGMILGEEVQPGLLISGLDLNYVADYQFNIRMARSVNCAILLNGDGQPLQVEGHGVIGHERGRVSVMGYGQTTTCGRPWRKGQHTRAFGIVMKPVFLERFQSSIAGDDLTILQRFMEPGVHDALLPESRTLIDIAESVLGEPYGGGLRSLYRESQALRFVFEIGQLLRNQDRLLERLGRRQYDRVHQAREILDRSLVDPPKLLDLARQLGVNVTTLQANFKAAFGTTVFGYVRSRRLEMARALILDHRLGIAEAGYRVGFNSAPAFTAAYRRHFGQAPSRH